MEVEAAVEVLENDSQFKDWKAKNKSAYLAHAFITMEKGADGEWQIGYYNKSNDTITTFTLGEKVTVQPDQEIFKKSGIVEKLDMKKVKSTLNEILKLAQDVQREKYTLDRPVKIIAILQNLKDDGQVWNITYLTERINTLNFKIKSDSKEILSHKLSPVMDLGKQEK